MNEARYLQALHRLQAAAWPAGTPREPHYPHGQQPLGEYLRTWARLKPEAPALDFYGHSLAWAELDRLADRCAALLAELGVRPGERVAVFLPNCPQLHVAFYGILRAGAVYVPVSPLSKALELGYQLNDSGAETLLCFDQLLPVVRQVRGETPLRRLLATSLSELCPATPSLPPPDMLLAPKLAGDDFVDFLPALEACRGPVPQHQARLDEVAALNYTGGTTGLPKGCVHTHGDMLYTCASYLSVANRLEQDSVLLNFLPEFWIAGENGGLLFPVFAGCRLVLLARWDAEAFMAAVQRYRVSHCTLLVDSAAEVLEHPRVGEYDFSSLRVSGAISFIKKLTPSYRQRWRELTGTTLVETSFGMTETHTCDTFIVGFQQDDFDLNSAPTFVGLPVPGTDFKVCDFETGELLPLGAEGELCIRSPSLLKGYWNRPEASAEVLRDGWLHTGDLGQITERGFIRYLGRRKEMIKVNGMSVFPSELEALLGQHPAVLASAVLARPDERRGQQPVAFVVLKPGAGESAESLLAWCREAMAVYKVPEVRVVASLPMTATGKIKKNELEPLL
ncbi:MULTISPECIES: AMP-binding protein [unclassified Pseudomonas]|uniref:AMP-binding protein n=1 Tax=unclassified Pseudomonas TaxID=196821 RepID=UPI0002A24399|nr:MULTISPECIES: AMP-binding protein [unclassified Pseudomonas]MBB1610526.1 acyl-CoA synthetase [Pseudomonas sp. UMC76]MBB1640388.1 acyl-CoA synthetase [Pseudomonas sp. UME83]NTX91224.1 acyl-CoA synthetase [Pseudomonas sp. UMA643]NTY17839.1 acyl-CoA synthetase [Pseudomonas sp. UMC3103]NTY24758.1 acyl-CoA synthetase [Pseudomonas sp. UMA603]